ncbi:hypothetical protein LIER_31675 [Lithospermum erythrorhizon]|uniref:Uncharacterized protein n=1 Tax=Lithospermum erythrorhizon TaxID=34254 RepID=A0AAV3RSP6_LITER
MDTFSDDVRQTFSFVHTSLGLEESPEVSEGLKKLDERFPKALPLDVFCEGWECLCPKSSELLGHPFGNHLIDQIFSPQDASTSATPPPPGISQEQPRIAQDVSPAMLSVSTRAEPPISEPEIHVVPESPSPTPEGPSDIFVAPDHYTVAFSLRGISSLIGEVEGYNLNHPLFVGLPYTFHSGLQMTLDMVLTPSSSVAVDMLKHCILRQSVLGAL